MSKPANKAALLSSIGAGLEYYDFIIYGMMAEYLGTLFFSADETWLALVKSFGIFAIGYLTRPLGGILFGMAGDTYGRKSTFISVMLLMAISTFSIGLLPTYSQIGVIAPCLLIILRILQGLSFGAELPGAITVVCEYTSEQKRGLYSGFVISSVTLGSILASAILFLITYNFSKEQILDGLWRVPFMFGGILAFANYFIRKYLPETPEFSKAQLEREQPAAVLQPILEVLKNYKTKVLLGIGITSLMSSLVIYALYFPVYLTKYYSYTPQDVYLAMTWGMIWAAFCVPLAGWISDHYRKNNIIIVTSLLFAVCGFLLFSVLDFGGFAKLIAFMCIYQTVIAFLTVSYWPILVDLFPIEIRYTGMAACYNITYSFMACSPLIIIGLINATGMSSLGIWFLVANGALSAFCAGMLLAKGPKKRTQTT